MGEGGLLVREGDFYFQNNIKFFKGAGLGCRLGRSWTVPTGHQDPPCTPKGILSPDSLFYFVLVESGTCLSLWGPLRASGTLPSGRSPLPRPSVLDGAHWAPGPEPAGETLPPSLREVPPEAVEGVKKGDGGRMLPFFIVVGERGIPLGGRGRSPL